MDRPLLMPHTDNSADGIAERMARQSLYFTRRPCEYCGDKYPAGEMTKTETGYLCKECSDKGKSENAAKDTKEDPEGVMEAEKKVKTFHCAYCGKTIGKGNMTKMAGKWACNGCGADQTVQNAKPPVVRISPEYLNIEHPAHYTQKAGVECIQVTELFNFNRGNAIKYIWRAGDKDPAKETEDLKKARWYLDREIKRVEDARK